MAFLRFLPPLLSRKKGPQQLSELFKKAAHALTGMIQVFRFSGKLAGRLAKVLKKDMSWLIRSLLRLLGESKIKALEVKRRCVRRGSHAGIYIKNICNKNKLRPQPTIKESLIVQKEGSFEANAPETTVKESLTVQKESL